MAEGSSDDDLDWFERAVQTVEAGAEDGDDAETVDPEDDEPDAGAEEGGDGDVEEADTFADVESASEPGAGKEPVSGPVAEEAAEAMDDIAAAFDVDADESGSTGDRGSGGSFGFDMETSPGDDFGFGVTQETDTFEEEEYHTDLPRIKLGIEGLDEMIQGGVPERSLTVAIGGAGTGKTTFGLQFLEEALSNGERAVFITLEESQDRIIQSAREKGWDFAKYEEEGSLAVIDLDPIDMANSLASIRSELPRLVEDFGASRLVLDSVSLLEMMYEDQATRRTEIYDFARALKNAGVTTMLTSEADEDNPFASRFGIIEYLTDAVFILRYVRPEDFRETRLAVEIQKIRDANHSRETKPYEITSTGISVYRQANIF